MHLLGDGVNFDKVKRAISGYHLENSVLQHGKVDQVEHWLTKAHLYVHAAWYEPFGLVFLEAMASGLPCITLDGKGNRDVIEPKKNGMLMESQDVGGIR